MPQLKEPFAQMKSACIVFTVIANTSLTISKLSVSVQTLAQRVEKHNRYEAKS